MSKQKSQDPETDNEVTGNQIEQSELEGLSTTVEETAAPQEEAEIVPKVEKPKKSTSIQVNTVATVNVKGNKKMGVYKFLSVYPQDIYISTLLVLYYPHSFFTKDEWFQRIDEILNTPINN